MGPAGRRDRVGEKDDDLLLEESRCGRLGCRGLNTATGLELVLGRPCRPVLCGRQHVQAVGRPCAGHSRDTGMDVPEAPAEPDPGAARPLQGASWGGVSDAASGHPEPRAVWQRGVQWGRQASGRERLLDCVPGLKLPRPSFRTLVGPPPSGSVHVWGKGGWQVWRPRPGDQVLLSLPLRDLCPGPLSFSVAHSL